MENRINFYKDRVQVLETDLAESKKRLRDLSRLRLFLFFAVVATITLATMYSSWILIGTFGFVIWFGREVKRHASATNEVVVAEAILKLNKSELDFMKGNKAAFPYGDESAGAGHIYAVDLDIFGKGSLFQAIDRTSTLEGRTLLVNTILDPPKEVDVIQKRIEATKELKDDLDWRQRFCAIGTMAGETEKDMPALRSWVNEKDFFKGRQYWIWIAMAVSAISVSFIAWMFYVQEFYLFYLIGWQIMTMAIRGMMDQELKEYFSKFGSRTKLFQKMADLFFLVSSRKCSSALCREHFQKVGEASSSFLELSQLANRADQRLNGLIGPLMNGLFLFDIWNVRAIEKWRKKYAGNVDSWIVALANVDMLSSLANYRFNHPDFNEAEVTNGKQSITAIALGHPLLPFHESVKNDYEIGISTKAHIVTGSNMAGKSTFIRAVGLNLVLAMNGLPVCARNFRCTVMRIASCIRITDSLEEHASYFRAELIRLEHIVSLIGKGTPYIVLLDEILRGTNSDDKRMGTLAFFRKLKEYDCLAVLATHDLLIGKLEDEFPQHYSNYCFESELKGSELHFDYKLRRGVSSSTNATFLMKSLGLID